MRLVMVNHAGRLGGAERVLADVVETALAKGDEVVLVAPHGALAERFGSTVRHVPAPEFVTAGSSIKGVGQVRQLMWARRLRAVLAPVAVEADVVIVNGLPALGAFLGSSPVPAQVPVRWLIHDIVRRTMWRGLLRLVKPRLDLAVAVSQAAREPVERLGIPTTVAPNGVAFPEKTRLGEPPSPPFVIGCMAQITSWKGQDVLVRALRALPEHTHLELAGAELESDREYIQELHALVGSSPARERITFLGHVEPRATMRRWHVAVSPSREPEAFGLTIAEAMSEGIPVVATNHGAAVELVNGIGTLVDVEDHHALASALEVLIRDPLLRSEQGQAGRMRIHERYRIEERVRDQYRLLTAAH